MKLILMGPQGSGKGTVSRFIQKDFNIPSISTGDLLRQNIENKTPEGLTAQSYMNKGVLVPDKIVLDILKKRLEKDDCKNGFILDGFPRSIDQGKSLEKITDIDGVIVIDLPYDMCIERLITRRVCSSCGENYNTSSYHSDVCEKCGSPLYQRDDDKLDSIKNRLEVYDKQTTPLINFYSDRVYKLSGIGSPLEVYSRVKDVLIKLEANR